MNDIDDTLPTFPKMRGSDPRLITCRSKLQNRRSKLNQEINKEMMLRSGAENLYKATSNKRLRDTVALELQFVNSNLQLLKEQLAELNSSVEVYQENGSSQVPMIPMGLKETKEIDFKESFKDFILEHYSEDGADYDDNVQEFMDIRQAMRTPRREASGIALLFEYFNQLYFIERRFFPPERSLGIFFEWYDSLTGVPSCQRTVAFEKASVLFNIGALYTQIGARCERDSARGLDNATDSFLRAAGTFSYIHENFTNAPSMDLSSEMLDSLIHLMLAQARECLFAKLQLTLNEKDRMDKLLEMSQEAAQVASVYTHVYGCISVVPVKDYVPYSWISLVHVKREHYVGLAHYYAALALLDHRTQSLTDKCREILMYMHEEDKDDTTIDITVPKNKEEMYQLGRSHLRCAVSQHEESLRVHRLCRQLKKQDTLVDVLRSAYEDAITKYTETEDEDDFHEILDPPNILPSTQYQVTLTPPDFSQFTVNDLFYRLGPVAIFSAKHAWTAARVITLRKLPTEGYGFSVRGDAPVIVACVDAGGLAQLCGVKEGDFIVSVGTKDVKWSSHDDVVALIRAAGNNLVLKCVTPMDRSYLKQQSSKNTIVAPGHTSNSMSSVSSKGSSTSQHSTTSSSSGISSASSTKHRSPSLAHKSQSKLSWNPFRKTSTLFLHKGSSTDVSSPADCNVIMR